MRGSALSIALDRNPADSPYIRPDAAIEFSVTALNNTSQARTGLKLRLSKISPAGAEELIREQSIDLNAGQSIADTFTFTETQKGIWKVTAQLLEGSSLLSSSEIVMQVTLPEWTAETLAPEFAGDEPFQIKVKLKNSGKIAGAVHVKIAPSGNAALLDEDITLGAGEERMLSVADTITADRGYDIVLTNDLVQTQQKTVLYGYKETLVFNALPSYREGEVNLPYTLANSGNLAFQETIHAELFIVGVMQPLRTLEKTHNLYPLAEAISGNFSIDLGPGLYELRYRTMRNTTLQTISFSVIPAGIGNMTFMPQLKYPLGRMEFSYTVVNADTVSGVIPVTLKVTDASDTVLFSETRDLFLFPAESMSQVVAVDALPMGNYMVRLEGSKLAGGGVSFPFRVLQPEAITSSISVQPASDGSIPVAVHIANQGFSKFAGSVVIVSNDIRQEEPIAVESEADLNRIFPFDGNGLALGKHDIRATIIDSKGRMISETTQSVEILGADIQVTETPTTVELAAGSFVVTAIKVKNQGNHRGEARIRFTAFDTLDQERNITLEAGEEKEIANIAIDADADIPTGSYMCTYTLTGMGVVGGLRKGNFPFKVNGIKLDVAAGFDKALYQQGETAFLTLNISSDHPVTTPLELVVNWGDYNERREFTIDGGSLTQVFQIPLTQAYEGKVFYGIYHKEGRGIYLNDIYLNLADEVSVILDQQVYAPGDAINAIFRVSEAGTLTAQCFDQTRTVNIGIEATLQFIVPQDTLGGTHGISWSFTPTDPTHVARSGAKPFDVSGLVVKVARSEIGRGKYAPGETIQASLIFESNFDVTLELRTWTSSPEGNWLYLGAEPLTLSKERQNPMVFDRAFQTTEAGTHHLVYGLYRSEQLVVSGALAFDCGDAVLLGIATDRTEYPGGNETVKVRADCFGKGSAQLKLLLDDVQVDARNVTLDGVGAIEIILDGSQVSGGEHRLQALLEKDNLYSTRRSSFAYGTSLPDLVTSLADTTIDGLNYTYKVRVENSGKTPAAATLLMFGDNDVQVEGKTISALQPGTWQEVDFTWSGSGKAGNHKLQFAADDGNAVKEYSESNNTLELNVEVPALFYTLEIQPETWAANITATIYTRLINNQNGAIALNRHLTLVHDNTGQVVLAIAKPITLGAFAHIVETDLFETLVHPAGSYTLTQTIVGDNVDRTETRTVYIQETRAISGSALLEPATIRAGADTAVNVKMDLKNAGNVALEDEPLSVVVMQKESQTVVKTENLAVTLNLNEQKLFEKSVALNLAAGLYLVRVMHGEAMVAEAELSAIEGLEKQKGISARPRVLMLNLLSLPFLQPKNHLKVVLQSAGIQYTDTDNLLSSYLACQKGEQTVNAVFGNLVSPLLKSELMERVFRGEGLILFCGTTLAENGLEELAGVNVRNMSLLVQEKNVTALPGVLGPGGSFSLLSRIRIYLEKRAEDVVVVAETNITRKAVMAYRPYGAGKVVTIAVPLESASDQNLARQLLLSAVALLNNPGVYGSSDLSRVVPVELRIKNSQDTQKSYIVKEIVPQGVDIYGHEPNPEPGEELKWKLDMPAKSEKGIFYWAKLWDRIGTFDLKSEIYESDKKLDEATLRLEVLQGLVARIDEIVVEIGQLNATGTDKDRLDEAVRLLERVRNRTNDDILSLWLSLSECVMAGKSLRQVQTVNVALIRLNVGHVMNAMARRFWDKARTLSPIELLPFSSRLQE